ncbi:MAG TPA: hypothetical protein VK157_06380 [Phycisphaerales bacterium]|nr:hypothetical protein [Phycisphaerales bacterium]
MHTVTSRSVRFACAMLLAALAGSAIAGPITPPAGPVTSTMKTMTEVEPRIAINSVNTPGDATTMFVISQPGSYYLTSDITTTGNKVGIRILASDVTVDLNGMTVRRGAGATSSSAIRDDIDTENAEQTITIRNGTIRGFATAGNYGIYSAGNTKLVARDLFLLNCAFGITVENGPLDASGITATGTSTTAGYGLSGTSGTIIAASSVSNFGTGYYVNEGLLADSVATGCGMGANVTRARVENFAASTTLSGAVGMEASAYSTVSDSLFTTMTTGIKVLGVGVLIDNCTFNSGNTGVQLWSSDAVVRNNVFKDMTTIGSNGVCIKAEAGATRNVIENNQGSNFNFGISIAAAGNTVIGNKFGNPLSSGLAIYSFPIGTRHGAIVKVNNSTSGVIVGSSTPGVIPSTLGTTEPTANLYW